MGEPPKRRGPGPPKGNRNAARSPAGMEGIYHTVYLNSHDRATIEALLRREGVRRPTVAQIRARSRALLRAALAATEGAQE